MWEAEQASSTVHQAAGQRTMRWAIAISSPHTIRLMSAELWKMPGNTRDCAQGKMTQNSSKHCEKKAPSSQRQRCSTIMHIAGAARVLSFSGQQTNGSLM